MKKGVSVDFWFAWGYIERKWTSGFVLSGVNIVCPLSETTNTGYRKVFGTCCVL